MQFGHFSEQKYFISVSYSFFFYVNYVIKNLVFCLLYIKNLIQYLFTAGTSEIDNAMRNFIMGVMGGSAT